MSDSDTDIPLAQRIRRRKSSNSAASATSSVSTVPKRRAVAEQRGSKSKKRPRRPKPFTRVEFALGQYLEATEAQELTKLIKENGGRIVSTLRRQTRFLVQSHAAEDCDERIGECDELGILGVPPAYVRACATAGRWCSRRDDTATF